MALPIPDKGRVLFCQKNYSPPTQGKVASAYDLYLYPEVGSSDRAVLVVYTTVQFIFVDGKSSSGTALTWAAGEQKPYAQKFVDTIFDVWDDRHRLKDTSGNAQWKDIGVVFEVDYWVGGWVASEHWELQVVKVDGWHTSFIWPRKNTGEMDNLDLDMTIKVPATGTTAAIAQRPAAHEFGHCLGLKDEYVDPEGRHNPHWTTDRESILASGEKVRERHYAPFAQWVTQQFENDGSNRRLLKGGHKPIWYKVNGTTDMSNAKV
jgi:hypothetical protein